jgi:hypothetical protein
LAARLERLYPGARFTPPLFLEGAGQVFGWDSRALGALRGRVLVSREEAPAFLSRIPHTVELQRGPSAVLIDVPAPAIVSKTASLSENTR